MFEDELMVGTDLDEELEGREIEPLDLVLEISKELKTTKTKVKFENYKNIDIY